MCTYGIVHEWREYCRREPCVELTPENSARYIEPTSDLALSEAMYELREVVCKFFPVLGLQVRCRKSAEVNEQSRGKRGD